MIELKEIPVNKFRVAMLGGLLIAQLSVPSFAQTVSLPAAGASWYVGSPGGAHMGTSPGSGSYTETGNYPGQTSTATVSASFGGSWVTGSINSTYSGLQNSFSGDASFYFEIFGPGYATQTHSPVSMDILAQLSAQASGFDSSALAGFYVDGPTPVRVQAYASTCAACSPSQAVTINGSYTFQTNSVYIVHLDASCVSGPYGSFASACQASADPTFTLDPSLGSAYQLVVSPDVDVTGTVPAVPEPAAWALALAGLGFVGLHVTRQKYRSRIG